MSFWCCCNVSCDTHAATILGCNAVAVGSGYTVTLRDGSTTVDTQTTNSSGVATLTKGATGSNYYLDVTPPGGSGYASYTTGPFSLTCTGASSASYQLSAASGWHCYACCNSPVPDTLYVTLSTGQTVTVSTGATGTEFSWSTTHLCGASNPFPGIYCYFEQTGNAWGKLSVYCQSGVWKLAAEWGRYPGPIVDCDGVTIYSFLYMFPDTVPPGGPAACGANAATSVVEVITLGSVVCNGGFSATGTLSGASNNPWAGTVGVSS